MQRWLSNYQTSLAADLLPDATTLLLADPPPLTDGDWIYVAVRGTVNDQLVEEVIKIANTGLEITRAQSGTTLVQLLPAGSLVSQRLVASAENLTMSTAARAA